MSPDEVDEVLDEALAVLALAYVCEWCAVADLCVTVGAPAPDAPHECPRRRR